VEEEKKELKKSITGSDRDDLSSLDERSSFARSESDRDIFARQLSEGGSLIRTLSLNEIIQRDN